MQSKRYLGLVFVGVLVLAFLLGLPFPLADGHLRLKFKIICVFS